MPSDVRSVVSEFLDAHRAKDARRIESLLAPRLAFWTKLGTLGKRDYVDFANAITAAWPDLAFDLRIDRVDGDEAIVAFGMSGTHERTFTLHAPGMKPLAPTHKRIALPATHLHMAVKDGLITRI